MIDPYRVESIAGKSGAIFSIHDSRRGNDSCVGRVFESDLAYKVVDLLNEDAQLAAKPLT